MAVCAHHCSVKDFVLLASSILLLCDLVCLADPRPSDLPAPSLTRQTLQGGGAIDLVCRAPDGHAGVLFRLVRVIAQVGQEDKMVKGDKVDLVEFPQERQEAHFILRGEAGLDQQLHCCMYQDRHRRYSGCSPYIRPSELLPPPTLSLLEPDPVDQGVTVRCTGPQAYPGARFTLFRLGSSLPVSSHPADHTRHEVYFTLPVLRPDPDSDPDPDPEQYQCQYSMLLGQHRSESERSLPITVPSPTGTNFIPAEVSPPPSPSPFSAPDWPLIAGCVSAVLLFLVVLTGLGIGVHRRVKALAEKKKRREEDRFWKHRHAMDHTLDLTLRRISIGSQGVYAGPGSWFHSPPQNVFVVGPSVASLYV